MLSTPAIPTIPTRIRDLLDPLQRVSAPGLALDRIGRFTSGGVDYEIPRVTFTGSAAGHDPIRLGIFAGIHGDEPAGCAALVRLVAKLAADPAMGAGYELMIYPVINPTGYECGTRTNRQGKDLNREFWGDSPEPEIRLLEAELKLQQFAGIITLHADDTCEGVYGYTHGKTLNEALLKPALRAASRILPLDGRAMIDGFAACDGLIHECFQGILSAPPDQHPQPFDLIFETPAHADFGLQVEATVAAVESIIAAYPGFIAYAQDL